VRANGILVGGLTLLALGIALMVIVGELDRSYETNGERIYFTGKNEEGERIAYSGAPFPGVGAGALGCASCHGGDAEGGRHWMHMLVMDAPDIRWSALAGEAGDGHDDGDEHGEYDLAAFGVAVVEGRHPGGEPLSDLMPRWKLSDRDLADLAAFLQSLD
jgi:cytochrome c oxidase subunit II